MSKRQPEGAVQAAPQEGARGAAGPTLTGKVVLITGASSGIGRAMALACAEAGADLALTYRANRRGADDTAESVRRHGRRAELLSVDVADELALETMVVQVREAFGRVDVWVNNAGADILTGEAARLTWPEKLDRLLAVDLRGTVLASWKAVALMRGQPSGGVILNVSWDHVLAGGTKGGYAEVFCAAKGGVYSFSRALARSVAPHIRVNVLGPGWIETAYGESLDPTLKERITRSIPLSRWGTPQDVAHAAVYLASDAASYVTGQMLMINGGAVVAHGQGDAHGAERPDVQRSRDRAEAERVTGVVVRGRVDPADLQDGRLADHADAGERDRLLLRGGVPSPGSVGHVGPGDREAPEPRRRGDHRQGLRAGPQARGHRAVAPQGRRPRGNAEQVRAVG